jgi:hypothetical protein
VKQQYEGGKENLIKKMSATQEVFIAVGMYSMLKKRSKLVRYIILDSYKRCYLLEREVPPMSSCPALLVGTSFEIS